MDIVPLIATIVTDVILGVVIFILQSVIKENHRLKQEKEETRAKHDAAIEAGLVCVLRKHLMDDYNACMAKGYITATELESGLLMYDAYKTLGGNGMIDHMKEEIENLHVQN